jgi:hypothetical protein
MSKQRTKTTAEERVRAEAATSRRKARAAARNDANLLRHTENIARRKAHEPTPWEATRLVRKERRAADPAVKARRDARTHEARGTTTGPAQPT